VEIAHAQWLYRNFTLHHYAKGYLQLQTEQDIRKEVNLLTDTRPSDLPTKCCYLLELPQILSTTSSAIHDAYWVLALKQQKQLLPGTKESMHERAPECNVENPKPPRIF
jgi:hypothetical protein